MPTALAISSQKTPSPPPPDAGARSGRRARIGYHREVLEQQDRERQAAVAGGELVALGERLQGEGGRRQGQGEPGDHGGLERQSQRESETGEYEGGQSDLPAAQPEHRTAHGPEAARLQLEADDEEQKDDAELREMKDLALVIHQVQCPGADDQACQHVAEDRAHSGPPGERDDDHGRGEKDGNLFEKRHATHPFRIQTRPLTRILRPRFPDPTLSPARAGTAGAS